MQGCISRYVVFHATPQMGQRSSKMVQLFFAEALKYDKVDLELDMYLIDRSQPLQIPYLYAVSSLHK
jgi:hypothetical protein